MSRGRVPLAVSAAALFAAACHSGDSSPVAASVPSPASQSTTAPPASPATPAPTQQNRPPRIVSMYFDTLSLPTAEDCPLPGELARVACSALDEDADIVSMEVRLEALATASFSPRFPTSVTQHFADAAATRRGIEALFELLIDAAPQRSARATCEVVDSRGLKDSRTRFCGWQ